MRLFRKFKEEGLSLRLTFLLMLFISLAITASLLFTNFRTIKSFHALNDAMDTYIDLQDAADSLLRASDYLTEQAQRYTVIGDRKLLDNYFHETETVKRREKALRVMEERLPDSDALEALKGALQGSVTLMDREYYAMRLVLSAKGETDIPRPLDAVFLGERDDALTPAEKIERARVMMHDSGYYAQKDAIRAKLDECVNALKNGTHGTQIKMEKRMHTDLVWMTILIALQSVSLIFLLWVTNSLGINPLLKAVEHIKQDQKLPITGAHEFRYLAGTYNNMYTVYKRSIDNLSFKASHDELTGVYNRAGYDLIKKSVDLHSTAFLLVDADNFKTINDQYGHEVGDRALQRLAATLRQNFRADDYVCRIGGDEFMVLMVHVTPDVKHLIERKIQQINEELRESADGLPPMSVSVGVSLCRDTENPQEMFHEADVALYYVKDNGRNGCCFYKPGMRGKDKQKAG